MASQKTKSWENISGNLSPLLRPPGAGIFSASSFLSPSAESLHLVLFGTIDPFEVIEQWHKTFDFNMIGVTPWIMIGVPSHAGSGSASNTAHGPAGIRHQLIALNVKSQIFDIGDILTVPHLLHDDILNNKTLKDVRHALFGNATIEFPVSPLSVAQFVYREILSIFPRQRILALGGDHSIAGACISGLSQSGLASLGILHFDAHSDLEPTRFGLRHTYSTWLEDSKIGMPLVVVQCGLNQHSTPEEVKRWGRPLLQITRDEIRQTDNKQIINRIIDFLKKNKIKNLYISLDIDVTDKSEAPRTGLPADPGLFSHEVIEIINLVAAHFEIVGADVVETASQPIDDAKSVQTCATAAQYVHCLSML